MSFGGKIGNQIKNIQFWLQARKIYQFCHENTMVAEDTFVKNLAVADRARAVAGCIVECGVWRGGMSAGLCRWLGAERTYYLFDSFEGLPPAKPIDGALANTWQKNVSSPNFYDNCKASPDFAQHIMKQAGAQNYYIVPGWFDKILPGYRFDGPIALLRLDGDWYDSTMVCLENLFDQVAENGIIVLDDYYTWDGCSRAVHDFLSRHSAVERVRNLGDVCYLIKSSVA
jgi:O-methyltransferase